MSAKKFVQFLKPLRIWCSNKHFSFGNSWLIFFFLLVAFLFGKDSFCVTLESYGTHFFKPFLFFYLMEPTVESYSVKWQQFRASIVSSTLQLVINQGRKLQQGAKQDYQNLLSDDVLYLAISKLTLGSRDVQLWNYLSFT